MKKCPNCGAQIDDNSLFCAECGKQIPQGNVCPHCGASVSDGVSFCPNCGKSIASEAVHSAPSKNICPHCGVLMNEDDVFCQSCGKNQNEVLNSELITHEEEESKNRLKKCLPYILGGVILVGIIGYCSSHKSSVGDTDILAADNITVDSVSVVSDLPLNEGEAKEALEKILSKTIGVVDTLDFADYAYSYYTSEYRNNYAKMCERADKEGGEYPKLWWSYSDSDPEEFVINEIEMISPDEAKAKVRLTSEMYIGDFDVILKMENESWLIDKSIEVKTINNPDFAVSEETENYSGDDEMSSDNPNAKYVGAWSLYINSEGQRVKVYTAVINRDMTCEFITYLPDGSRNASISLRQCVFRDGYAFFTDNGDITIKGTPRFRLGSSGLQSADGINLVRE